MAFTPVRGLEIGFVVFMLIMLIVALIQGEMFDASVAAAGVFCGLIPILIERFFKFEFDTALKIAYILFLFASQYLGSIVGLYGNGWWDIFLHVLSGVFLSFLAIDFLHRLDTETRLELPTRFVLIYILGLSMAGAALWELYEFTSDIVLDTTMQANGNIDTMTDLVAGTLGGLLTAVYGSFQHRKERYPEKKERKK